MTNWTDVAVGLAAHAAGRLETAPAAGQLGTTQARLVATRTVCVLPRAEGKRHPGLHGGPQRGNEHKAWRPARGLFLWMSCIALTRAH